MSRSEVARKARDAIFNGLGIRATGEPTMQISDEDERPLIAVFVGPETVSDGGRLDGTSRIVLTLMVNFVVSTQAKFDEMVESLADVVVGSQENVTYRGTDSEALEGVRILGGMTFDVLTERRARS